MGKAGVDGSTGGMGGGFSGGMGGFPGGMGGAFGGAFGGVSPEDLFSQLFGGGMRARQPQMRDQKVTLPVTLEDMYNGGTRRIAVPRPYLGSDGRVREERLEVPVCSGAVPHGAGGDRDQDIGRKSGEPQLVAVRGEHREPVEDWKQDRP